MNERNTIQANYTSALSQRDTLQASYNSIKAGAATVCAFQMIRGWTYTNKV